MQLAEPAPGEPAKRPYQIALAMLAKGFYVRYGGDTIQRFLRPVCYQNLPRALLPAVLRDPNERGVWRRRDGLLTRN